MLEPTGAFSRVWQSRYPDHGDPTSLLETPTKTPQSVTQPAAQWKLFAENYRHDLGWSPDGRFLASADHSVIIWQVDAE
nr:hypothetical protein [Ktedonobacter sp. SOSP1-52]